MKDIMCKHGNISFNKTIIMGILNVTPDSFSDGGEFNTIQKALTHAKEMIDEGAHIIDIGGESTRPGAEAVSEEEELERVIPVIKQLRGEQKNIIISIDTQKATVADAAIKAGADIVNDVSGLRYEEMIKVIAKHQVPCIIMHMRKTPQDMQQDISYENVVKDIKEYLTKQITKAKAAGIQDIMIDPGIGFGKTVTHNLQLLKNISVFSDLDCPILIGTSRKSFIGKISNTEVDDRLEGSLVSASVAILNGAHIVRVHDVKETRKAMQVIDAIKFLQP